MGLEGASLKQGLEGEEWLSKCFFPCVKGSVEVMEMLAEVCGALGITAGTVSLSMSVVGKRGRQKRLSRSLKGDYFSFLYDVLEKGKREEGCGPVGGSSDKMGSLASQRCFTQM